MNWFEPLDNYCERLDAAFWAEPLNALSNLAFIVAGLLLLFQRGKGSRPPSALALIINVLIIGVGSFLFHTLANRWTELADVLPVTIFIHLYFLLALNCYLGLRWWLAALAALALLAVSPLIGQAFLPLMGGSAFYAPALLAIIGVALATLPANRSIAASLLATGLVFAVSILFRAADMPLCANLATGTHMLWHMLNAIVLYRLVRLYVMITAAPAAH